MKRKTDERGAALVIVLGIIMLLMIFAGTLAAQMTNTQTQLNTTDKVIDARNLARMGLDRAGIKAIKAFDEYDTSMDSAQGMTNVKDKEKKIKESLTIFEEKIKEINDIAIGDMGHQRSYSIGGAKLIKDTNGRPIKIDLNATGYSRGKSINETSTVTIQQPN